MSIRRAVKNSLVYATSVVFMISGFLVGLVISQFLDSNRYSIPSFGIAFLFVFLGVAVSILIHNLGHMIAGNILGYKYISRKTLDFSMIPSKKPVTLTQQGFYYFSGILANLFISLVLIISFFSFSIFSEPLYKLLQLTISVALILNACINLSSYFSSESPNDGKILWSILEGSPFAQKYLLENNVILALNTNERPADIPLEELNINDIPDFKNTYPLQLALFHYYKALDSKDTRGVLTYSNFLEKYINLYEDPEVLSPDSKLYNYIAYELCFISCVKGNKGKAMRYYNWVKDSLEKSYNISSLRVRAYYEYFINDSKDTAFLYSNAAMDFSDSIELKGLLPLETNLLKELIAKS